MGNLTSEAREGSCAQVNWAGPGKFQNRYGVGVGRDAAGFVRDVCNRVET